MQELCTVSVPVAMSPTVHLWLEQNYYIQNTHYYYTPNGQYLDIVFKRETSYNHFNHYWKERLNDGH